MVRNTKIQLLAMTLAALLGVHLGACGMSMDGDWSGSPSSGGESSSTGNSTQPEPGQLTAGDWDDNANFEWFLDFLADLEHLPVPQTTDRVVIKVVNDEGEPISAALVEVTQAESTLLHAPTSTDGRLVLFPGRDGAEAGQGVVLRVTPPGGQSEVEPVVAEAAAGDGEVTVVLSGAASVMPTALDLVFVIDTTGSMSDELSYLQAEVQSIVDHVQANAGVESLRLALITYRDFSDDYVTNPHDFTETVSNFQNHLDLESAGGGGDYPEAVEEAFADLGQLSWRDGNVARVVFWIADAPSHDEDMGSVLQEIKASRHAGIRIFPIAASGVAEEAEFLMRTAAQATLGRYLFLTNDSGIGSEHAEPHIPCYQVQHLNTLMTRMILSVLGGRHIAPEADDILRTAGEPVEGVCQVEGHPDAYL